MNSAPSLTTLRELSDQLGTLAGKDVEIVRLQVDRSL